MNETIAKPLVDYLATCMRLGKNASDGETSTVNFVGGGKIRPKPMVYFSIYDKSALSRLLGVTKTLPLASIDIEKGGLLMHIKDPHDENWKPISTISFNQLRGLVNITYHNQHILQRIPLSKAPNQLRILFEKSFPKNEKE